jgi:hypothetical protein
MKVEDNSFELVKKLDEKKAVICVIIPKISIVIPTAFVLVLTANVRIRIII